MSLRRGEHGSQLKQIVTSQQLAGGEAVLGRLLASTKDDFRYRLVVDDTGIDVIIHKLVLIFFVAQIVEFFAEMLFLQPISGLAGVSEACRLRFLRGIGLHNGRILQLSADEIISAPADSAAVRTR